MSDTSAETTRAMSGWGRVRKLIAGGAAAALAAGMLVVAGVGVQSALAAGPAPGLSVEPVGTYIAGEDLRLSLTFTSNPAAGPQYNVSSGIVLPEGVTIEDPGTLGTPKVFPATPGGSRVISGLASSSAAQCEALGLEPVTPGQLSGRCQVPAGKQYVVFENISDLPLGASTTHTLTLRPDADLFPVGSTIDFDATAFTSDDPKLLPQFPGSSSRVAGNAATSDPGVPNPRTTEVEVNALRLEKSEPSPDNELLRGVHDHTTTYTLRVWHTGEGDLSDVTVTDLIPAGLEYLGLGGAVNPDRTTNANGTQSSPAEYPGAASLDATPAPADSTYSGDRTITGARDLNAGAIGESVETVVEGGEVFTKVTWNIGQLLASGLASYSIVDPEEQGYPETEGKAGFFEIRYRAAVPLFENTMDFDGAGGQPSADDGRSQIANLDNNRGASTRHGDPADPAAPGEPKSYTNRAVVSGSYGGNTVEDEASHTIRAVDVRVLKGVDQAVFEQTGIARYTLTLDRSEYVTATVPGPDQRPYRLVDDLADGLCPVFPAGTVVADGASDTPGLPDLVLGDPRTSGATHDNDAAAWNAAIAAAGVDPACGWTSSVAGSGDELVGAKLIGIAFDETTGHFFVDLELDPQSALSSDPAQSHEIEYSARQNKAYLAGEGLTTSGDVVNNRVEIYAETSSIGALDGVTSAGSTHPENTVGGDVADGVWNAWDGDSASLQAELTRLNKRVLPRDYSGAWPDASTIDGIAENEWVKSSETPFSVGDEVWYRIDVVPPQGTDVRNPQLTDFLPAGVVFDGTDGDGDGIPDDMRVIPSAANGIGDCVPDDSDEWVETFVEVDVDGRAMIFTLGDHCGLSATDRFLPLATTLTVFLKVTVSEQSAFGEVDLPENQAKYQQNNVDGLIHFDRSSAEIVRDQGVYLRKGIKQITHTASDPGDNTVTPALPNPYNSNVDGDDLGESAKTKQGDEVEFRLDVSAPFNGTTGYVLWDALPTGIKKADLQGINPTTGEFTGGTTAARVTQSWVTDIDDPMIGEYLSSESPADAGEWTAHAYDPGDPGYPGAALNDEFDGRTIVVWEFTGPVPGSLQAIPAAPAAGGNPATPAKPAASQGLTLGYTVTVPAPGGDGGDAAQLGQRYVNDASIVELSVPNNSGEESKLIVNGGDEHVAKPRDPSADPADREFALEDGNGQASDPSNFEMRSAQPTKAFITSEITPSSTPVSDAQNAQNAIVQGERAIFEYRVTIPANTTVKNGVLADLGNLVGQGSGTMTPNTARYQLDSAALARPTSGITLTQSTSDPATPHATDFHLNTATGKLTFPVSYTTGASEVEFAVRIEVRINDIDESHPTGGGLPNADRPQIPNGKVLANTANFSFDDPNRGGSARVSSNTNSPTVTYREPLPTITKARVGSGAVHIDDSVSYTLAVGSNASRPKSYDNVVVDTVPAGLMVDGTSTFTVSPSVGTVNIVVGDVPASGSIAANTVYVSAGAAAGTGGPITWHHEAFVGLKTLSSPAQLTFGYTAKIADTAGAGATYQNTARITGQTLPDSLDDATNRRGDRAASSSANVTAAVADLAKGVRIGTSGAFGSSVSAPVGETVQYQLVATLQPRVNYYDVRFEDQMPAGVQLVANSAHVEMTTGSGSAVDVTDDWAHSNPSGTNHRWSYTPTGGDLASNDETRVITLTYQAKVTDAVGTSPFTNTARFTWGSTNGASEANRTGTPNRTAQVNLLTPQMGITKKVDFESPIDEDAITLNPDGSFDYLITAYNSGTAAANRTPAHNVTVQDRVPAGVKVDVSSISPTPSSVTGDIANGAGGTITWLNQGPFYPQAQAGAGQPQSIEYGYSASFADSEHLTGAALVNYANVPHWESFASDGRSYDRTLDGANRVRDQASVTPLFPFVELDKSVTTPVSGEEYGLAQVGEPFNWTLTLVNTGRGSAQTIDVTDVLPLNWEYVADSARIKVGNAATTVLDDPQLGEEDDRVTLAWELGEAMPESALLPGTESGANAVARTITITFDAVPQSEAIEDAGTGIEVNAHTNELRAVTTDTTGAEANAVPGSSFTGPDSEADAYIAEADLKLVKNAIGGVVEEGAPGAEGNLFGLDAGSWVAGQAAKATAPRYAQPQWEILVTNHGPDASEGWFEFEDTQTLPAGVTVSGWSASYHNGATVTPLTDLEVTEGNSATTGSFKFRVGENLSLSASGSDYIRIVGNVNLPSDLATGSSFENAASVLGETFERESKIEPSITNPNPNSDDEAKTSVTAADLQVVKTVNTAEADRGAGKPVSWNIAVTNLGPSTSLSGTEKITVSDEVPTGISGVADPSVAGTWIATMSRPGDPAATWPATAGDTITWTYQGASIAAGASPATITLSGMIDANWPANTPLPNTATVDEGDTRDPNPDNDTSTVPVTPSVATEIDVQKTRVVFDADADEWVAATEAPVPGEHVSYLLEVTNLGPATARGVTVTDELPSYLSYVDFEDVVGTWDRTTTVATGDQVFALDAPAPLASPIDLPSGDTSNRVSFVITTLLDSDFVLDEDSVVRNDVVADADNADPDDDFDESNTPTRRAELEIEKTHVGAAVAGEQLVYEITVTNNGPSASRGPILVTDTLPTHFAYVADSSEISFNGGAALPIVADTSVAGRLGWTVGSSEDSFTLPVGDSFTISLAVDIASTAPNGVYPNTATTDGGPDGPGDSDVDNVTLEREADMTLVKKVYDAENDDWVDATEAIAGEQATFRLFIENLGPSANPANIVDTLPAHLTLVSVTPQSGSAWVCPTDLNPVGASTVTCAVASPALLPVGESYIDIVVDIAPEALTAVGNDQTTFTNEAVLSWTDRRTTDPDQPHTSEDDADVIVSARADLGIVKQAFDADGEETATAVAGTTLEYGITLRNEGPTDAIAPLVVQDTLPAGISFVRLVGANASSWQATVDPSDEQHVTFTRVPGTAGLAAGASAPEIRFEVEIDRAVADGATLVNTAEIDSSTLAINGDPTSGPEAPDSDDAPVTVEREVEVPLVKGHDAVAPVDEYEVGDEAVFTIDVRNHGPSLASDVRVEDTIPSGLLVKHEAGDALLDDSGDPTGWTIDSIVLADPANPAGGALVTAVYADDLEPGAQANTLRITVEVTVGIGDVREITNVAEVFVSERNLSDDTEDDDTIVTVPIADLTIGKSVVTSADRITAGEPVTWLLQPRNAGPSTSLSSEDHPITVSDTLPQGVRSLVADPSNAQWTAATSNAGGWAEATAGDTITWTFTGERFAPGDEPDIEVTALIDAAWHDGDITNVAAVTPGETRDPDPSNNEDEVTVTPGDSTALDIWKNRVVQIDGEWVAASSLDPVPPLVPGTDITYRIDVANLGPAVARDVRVVDPIHEGLSDPRLTMIDGKGEWSASTDVCEDGLAELAGYPATDCLTVSLDGPLAVGQAEMRSFLVTFATDPGLDPEQSLVNWAQARATNVPPSERPNSSDDTKGEPGADLSIVKTVEQERVLAGSTVDYRLLVTNEGPSVARGPITVSDQLPVGLGYVPGSATVTWSDGTRLAIDPTIAASQGSELLSWVPVRAAEQLAPGETVLIELRTQLADGVFSSEGLVNTATVRPDDDYDYNPDNNESSTPVLVDPVVTLVVDKQSVGEFKVGEQGTYRISVENLGPTADPGPITLTDELPTGLLFDSSPNLPAGATVAHENGVVTWTLTEPLGVGQKVEVTLVVDVLASAYEQPGHEIRNEAVVDTPTPKSDDPRWHPVDLDVVKVKPADPVSVTGAELAGGLLAAIAMLMLLGGGLYLAGRRRQQARHG